MAHEKDQIPPFGRRLLQFFCPDHLYESIEGDLLERFEDDIEQKGPTAARRLYLWNVIRFFHPEIIFRNHFNTRFMNKGLIGSHTKISLRNLLKGRIYSAINIGGLALGIAACLLILSFTQFEKSYDHFHPDIDRLYRVNQTAIWDKDGGMMSSTTPPLAALLHDKFPEIESSMRINTPGSSVIRSEGIGGALDTYQENNILAVDSNFFQFFPLPLVEGSHEGALEGVGKVVITLEVAKKYFGSSPALGRILLYGDDRTPLQITAVTDDLPRNMHFDFDFLLSMPTNPKVKAFDWSWIWTQMVTYVKVRQGANLAQLDDGLQTIPELYIRSTFARLGMDFEDFVNDKGGWTFELQPVRSIHMGTGEVGNRIANTIDSSIVNILQILAILILIVAMINFVNLSTARAGTRHKEIGVKKTMGASPGSLVSQFLIESILISAIAMLLAIPLVAGLKYIVEHTAHIDIPIASIYQLKTIVILGCVTIVIGLFAGLYPAFYLSQYRIDRVFKGGQKSSGDARFRNGLVVVQFAVSMALIAGTLLIMRQIHYLQNKDLGFNKDHVLVINNADRLGNQIETFRNELADIPGIAKASISMAVPGRGSWEDIYMREGSNIKLPIGQLKIDDAFFSLLEFDLIAGRLFDEDRPADDHNVIINETTARLFGWTVEEALNKKILYPGYPEEIKVQGVVDDFHFQSLRQEINPMMFFTLRSAMWGDMRVVTIKYGDQPKAALLASLQSNWDQYANGAPFSYSFYDEELARMYDDEAQIGTLIGLFGGLTLFIAMIGLVGMVTYSVERRKKEIGIRKVLGASALEIFLMFNKQYVILGLIALAISIPISWTSMDRWLQAFAFRVDLHPALFILSGCVVMLLAGISVAYLSISAASLQPSDVLKDD